MKQEFEKLIELAKKWRAFSEEVNGWNVVDYEDEDKKLYVRCYFATNGNHTDVTIGDIGIAFFDPPQIDDIKIKHLEEGYLANVIKVYTAYLNKTKRNIEKRTKKEMEEEKQNRIKKLEEELKGLKKVD